MALQVRGEGDARHRRTPRSESLPAAGDDCNCQQTDRVERRLSSQCLSLRDSQISVARSEIVIPAKRATRARAGPYGRGGATGLRPEPPLAPPRANPEKA